MTTVRYMTVCMIAVLAVLVTVSRCGAPNGERLDALRQESESLQTHNQVLRAQALALDSTVQRTLAQMQADSARADSVRTAMQSERSRFDNLQRRADSLVNALGTDTAPVPRTTFNTVVTLKDSVINGLQVLYQRADSGWAAERDNSARLRVVVGTQRSQITQLLSQNSALVQNNADLVTEAERWRRKAQRRWFRCTGAGVAAVVDRGLRAGVGAQFGLCYRL